MSESYSLISAREHYLMQPVVDAFTDYLADYIAGRVFDPPYLTQTYRPKAQYCFTSLQDAWEQYIQEVPNREFQERLIRYEKPLKEVIDKRDDVVTLRNLGASDKQITRIFLFEGRLISFAGASIGVVLGLTLCWLQQEYGLISLGDSGNFIVNAYPVSVHAADVAIVFVTVLAVGFLSVWYPVRYLSKRLLKNG